MNYEVTKTNRLAAPRQPTSALPPYQLQQSPTTPDSSSSHSHTYATWAAFGVSVAGFGTGVISAIVTHGKRADLINQGCSSNSVCPRDRQIDQSDIDSYNSWREVSTVGFIVGGVGMAAAATLWLTESKSADSPRVGIFTIPGLVGARGSF